MISIRRVPRAGGLLLLASGAALLAGCAGSAAMSPAQRPLPATKGEARHELVELERQITETRVALGLGPPARLEDFAASGEAGAATGAAPGPAAGEAVARTEPDEQPLAAPMAPSPAPRAMGKTSSVASADAEESDSDRLAHCEENKSCRFTRAICHAAERICRLARFLEEADAQTRCRRAQKDCQDARQATQGTCSDC